MNQEIRDGSLATRLLKPIAPLIALQRREPGRAPPPRRDFGAGRAHRAHFGAGSRFPRDPRLIAIFAISLVGAWLVNFFMMAMIGSLAFFIESSTAVFEVWLLGS